MATDTPYHALCCAFNTDDPSEALQRVTDVKRIAALALFVRNARTDGELGAAGLSRLEPRGGKDREVVETAGQAQVERSTCMRSWRNAL